MDILIGFWNCKGFVYIVKLIMWSEGFMNNCCYLFLDGFWLLFGVDCWDFLFEVDGVFMLIFIGLIFGIEDFLFIRFEDERNFLSGVFLI